MRFTARQRVRYWFDNTMARGTVALIAWLFLASAAMIFTLSGIVHLFGLAPESEGERPGFVQLAWMGLMRTLDAGTMGGDQGSWPFLIMMLAVTMGGIFVVSTLIGLLTSGIESKVEELRKGRSPIVEEDHTVILGWSPEVFTIVNEIVQANANRKRACIAILATKDKVEMEDELGERIPDWQTTHIVCRTGSAVDLADLELVNPHDARSIIIIDPEGDDDDAHVIKTVLALTNNPNRHTDKRYHIVAKLQDPRNLQVAKMVGRDEAQFVLAGDLIARVTVQTCRQSGLSVVYTELLDFGGDEMYFTEEPQLVGKTFGEAILAYEDSSIIGLRRADGRIQVNPPMDSRIERGDRVIAISEDDDTVRISGQKPAIDESAIRSGTPRAAEPERTLIMGWNDRAATIVREMDNYVAPGSVMTVVTETAEASAELASLPAAKNMAVDERKGDTTDREFLDGLDLPSYDHVICLSPSQIEDHQEADSRSLVTLLHLRDIADRASAKVSIVSEMRDVRNRELAEITKADDFIVSERLVSLLLSQLSENRELLPVFEDLFDPEGSEIYLKPAVDYVAPGQEMTFYTVCESARRRGEVAFGYRVKALSTDAGKAYGIVVNPSKAERITFAEGDRVIVLAEN